MKHDNLDDYYCPTEPGIQALSGKWKSAIIWILGHGPRRFSELLELMPGISKQVLSDRLKEMERDLLLNKSLYAQRPERFEYGLTERGNELGTITKELCHWGIKYFPNSNFAFDETVRRLTEEKNSGM